MSKDVTTRFLMTQEQIDRISAVAGEAAVKKFREEQEKENRKRLREGDKARRAKKMLCEYRRIKSDLKDTRTFTKDEEEEFRWKFLNDLIENREDQAEASIQNEKRRRNENRYKVYRIERAIDLYRDEVRVGTEEDKRRFRAMCAMYIDDEPKTLEEIFSLEKVSDKTIYRDLGIACSIMGVYLYGI